MTDEERYGLARRHAAATMSAPALAYQPPALESPAHPIALIGCGGISEYHLAAYRKAGYHVAVLCDIDPDRAEARRAAFYPEATVMTDYRAVMQRDDIAVIDAAVHPAERIAVIEAAIEAGKHVLSQKPFVTDLDVGRRLCDWADARGVHLAVNQNGRWAPHFSWMRQAVTQGLVGRVHAVDFSLHWDHDWVADTVFNTVEHLLLFDFTIHWFDLIACLFHGRPAQAVHAAVARAPHQRAQPPLLGQVAVHFEDAVATIALDGACQHGQEDRTVVAGAAGTLVSVGPELNDQQVTLHTADGTAHPTLEGTWFTNGFHGTMAELLCAIEQKRTPTHNARDSIEGLSLCFAAVASTVTGKPRAPGSVRRLGQT